MIRDAFPSLLLPFGTVNLLDFRQNLRENICVYPHYDISLLVAQLTHTQEISASVIMESYVGSYPEMITHSLLQHSPGSLHMLASRQPDSKQVPIA